MKQTFDSPHYYGLVRYGGPVLAVTLALGVTLQLRSLSIPIDFLLLLAAVVTVSWVAGPEPAVLATILAVAAAKYFLIAPVYSFRASTADLYRFGIFAIVCLATAGAGSARERAHRALRESERRFRTMFDQAAVGIAYVSLGGRWLQVNDRLCAITRYSRQELLNLTFQEITHPDDLKDDLADAGKLISGGAETYNREKRYLRKDGSTVWVNLTVSLVRSPNGSPEYFVSVIEDITERRQLAEALRRSHEELEARVAERTASLEASNEQLRQEVLERQQAEVALRQSERMYRTLIETSPDAIALLDLDSRIAMANQRSAAVFGFPSVQETIGLTGFDLVAAEDRSRAVKDFRRTLETGIIRDIHYTMAKTDGSTFPAEISAASVIGPDGNPTGLIVVVHDSTQSQRLQAQFLQAQKMEAVGVLAGGVAHDFNNLLTVILGTTEMLLSNLDEGDPMRRDLLNIRAAGQRASSLTSQLLAFSRKQVRQPRIIDLNEVIADMGKMLHRLLGEDIELLTIGKRDLGAVKADPGQIQQIIMNLAVNARDAMPEGGRLTIETGNVEFDAEYARKHPIVREGRYVMMAVSDTGAGMDRETQGRIFEPFFTTKPQGKGTGLGLSTVYGIVKQSDGFVWVYSELGQGTTLKIYLPRVEGEAEEFAQEAQAHEDLTGTETVLMVEDDEAVRKLAARILSQHGYHVLEAGNALDASYIAQTHQGDIHLLITDVVMPQMSGKALSALITGFRSEIKTLYISGYASNAIVHHGVLDSGVAFLQKPFTPESLVRKVREVMAPA